jgi:hypothetical protein
MPSSVAVLAGLLFLPGSKLVWVISVRRLERRLGQPLSDLRAELAKPEDERLLMVPEIDAQQRPYKQ